MNIANVYTRLPVWMQNLALTAYGYRLNHLRYGGQHRALLARLLTTERIDASAISRLQLDALQAVVRHAQSTVPFYRDRLPSEISGFDDLLKVPLVLKADLHANRKRVTSNAYKGRLHEVHTGGTTGTPLTIYCSRAVLQQNYAFFARFRRWADTPVGVRTAVFAGRTLVDANQVTPPYWRSNRAANTMLFSSYHVGVRTVEAYTLALQSFRPQLIDSYPSALAPIADFLLRHPEIKVRPNAVITSSETLLPEVRAAIERAFECKVFDHYGSAEMAALITQCEEGSYHVNPEFGYLEILNEGRPAGPGELGEIVATGFINPVMPLIRYATGDLATWRQGSCSCGRNFPMVDRLMGRMDDVVTTPDGREIGRLDPIFKSVTSIQESQIVQDERDHLLVRVVAPEFPETEQTALLSELRKRLGSGMRIDIERVDVIPRTGRGKLRTVINLTRSQRPVAKKED